jgi:hypothetical protein
LPAKPRIVRFWHGWISSTASRTSLQFHFSGRLQLFFLRGEEWHWFIVGSLKFWRWLAQILLIVWWLTWNSPATAVSNTLSEFLCFLHCLSAPIAAVKRHRVVPGRSSTSVWYQLYVEAARRNLILPDLPAQVTLCLSSINKEVVCVGGPGRSGKIRFLLVASTCDWYQAEVRGRTFQRSNVHRSVLLGRTHYHGSFGGKTQFWAFKSWSDAFDVKESWASFIVS